MSAALTGISAVAVSSATIIVVSKSDEVLIVSSLWAAWRGTGIIAKITRSRSRFWLFSPAHGASGGVAHSLDEAKAAFRAAWKRPLLSLSLSAHDPSLT
jgi:hypothetical protein